MAAAFKNFLKFSFGTWVNALVSILSIPIITWFISPEDFGRATMFTLAYNLLLNVFLLGQDQSYARHFHDVQGVGRSKLLSETLLPSIVFALISSVIIVACREKLASLIFEDLQYVYFINLLCIVLLFGVISRFAQLILRMENRAVTYSVLQILLTVTNLMGIIAYAYFIAADLHAVIVAFSVSTILCAIIGVLFTTRVWRQLFTLRPVSSEVKTNIRYGLPFVPTFILDWVFQSADRTLLRLYSTFAQIGIYATAVRISSTLNIVQTGFNTFWVPFVFEKYSKDQHDKSFYQTTFDFIYLVFSFLILGLLCAKDLIYFFLAKEYYPSVDYFSLLLFVPMLYTLSEITAVGLNLKKKTIYHFYILIITCSVSVSAGIILIEPLGAKGAIISNVISYLVFFICRTVFGNRLYSLNLIWGKFLLTVSIILALVLHSFLYPLSRPYFFVILAGTLITIIHVQRLKTLVKSISNR